MQRTTLRRSFPARPVVVALAAAVALTATACAKTEDDNSDNKQSETAAGAEQKVVTPKPGSKTCTIDAYGAEKIDLKNATVGFPSRRRRPTRSASRRLSPSRTRPRSAV